MGQIKALLKKHAGWLIVITVIVIICCVIYFWRDIKKFMCPDTRECFQATSTWLWNTEIKLKYSVKYTTRGFLLGNTKYIIKTYPEIAAGTSKTVISPNIDTSPSTYSANMLYVLDFGIGKAQTAPIMYMPMTVENRGVSNEIFYKVYNPSYSITLKPAYIPSSKTEPNYYYMSYIYFNVTNAFHDTYDSIIRNIHINIDTDYHNDPVVNKDNINKNIYKDYDLIENNGGKLYPLFFNENYIQVDVSESNIATDYKVLDTDTDSGGDDHSIHYNIKNGSIFPCWTHSNQYAKYYSYNFYKNWIFNYRFKDYLTVKFTRDLTIPVTELPSECIYISFFHNRTTYYLVNPPNTDTITFTTNILLATLFKRITYSTLNNASKYITKDGTKILGVDAISSSYHAQLKLFACDSIKYEPAELSNTAELNNKLALHNVRRPWFLFDNQTNITMRNDGFNDQNNTVINSSISRSGGFTSLYGAGNYAPYLIIDTVAGTINLSSALHKIPLGEKTTIETQIVEAGNAAQFEIINPAKIDVGTFSTTYTIKDLYKFVQDNTITIYGFIHPSSNPEYCKLISYPDYKPITLETGSSVLNTTDNTTYKYDGMNKLTYSILSPGNCPDIKKLNGDTGFVLSKFTIPDETLAANYTTDNKTWTLTNNKNMPATKLFKKYKKTDDPNIYIFATTDNEYLAYDLSLGLKLVPANTININERFVNITDGQFIYYKNQVRFFIDAVDDNQYYLQNIPFETTIKPVSLFFTEFTPTTTTMQSPIESMPTTTTTQSPIESMPTTTTIQPPIESTPTTTTMQLPIESTPTIPASTIPEITTIPTTTTTKYITTTTTPSPIDMGTYMPAAPGVISFPVIQ